MVSSRFRHQVKHVLVKKRWCLLKCHRDKGPANIHRNQVCPATGQPTNSAYEVD
jgi:hypothetical protein